jgi:leucine-zipper of insertion element IS481
MVDIPVSADAWHHLNEGVERGRGSGIGPCWRVIGVGLSICQVLSKVGVSRQTLHAWLARHEAEGLEGSRTGRTDRRAVRIRCPPAWRRPC